MAQGRQQDYGREYTFKNVQILHNEKLGSGSYGAVYKARCDQLLCAAKKIFPVLFQQDPPEPGREHAHPLRRFESECEFLERINHPNIVQYLGVHREPGVDEPVLLMELMDESLTHFLESSPGDLPYHTQVNLSYDIAQALAFLHSNGIIHRDLSSNNVLLIANVRAKVTDFGMSKLDDINATHRAGMTTCPGTPVFMPPEALDEPPVYTNKLDNFSFGVIVIQTITRKFPKPTDRFITRELIDPSSPATTIQAKVAVPEVERRQDHIRCIRRNHPLLPIILDCLKDKESDRPTSQQLCQELQAIKETPDHKESAEQDKDSIIRAKDEQISTIQLDLATKIDQLKEVEQSDTYKDLLKAQDATVEKLTHQLNESRAECEQRTRQVRELGQQVESYEEKIEHLRHTHSTPNTPQAATQSAIPSQLTLEVESTTDKPHFYSSQIAVVKNRVYVSNKYSDTNKICLYDINTREWSQLIAQPVSKKFAIANVDNILTTVGGEGTLWNSNRLYSYQYNKWRELFPPMPNRWAYPNVASNKHCLIVSTYGKCQILKIDTLQWSKISWFPYFIHHVVLIYDYIYVSATHIESGSSVLEKGLITDNDIEWEETKHAPFYHVGCLTNLSDHLLAIGGRTRQENEESENFRDKYKYTIVQNIYEYIPSEDEWKIIGQMSKPRSHCLAAPLPDNKLIIIDSDDSMDIMCIPSAKTCSQ